MILLHMISFDLEACRWHLRIQFLPQLTSTYLTGSRYANDEKVKLLAARIMSSAMNGINANAYFKEVVS